MNNKECLLLYKQLRRLVRVALVWAVVTFSLLGLVTSLFHVLQTVPGSAATILVAFAGCACVGAVVAAGWLLRHRVQQAVRDRHAYYVVGNVKAHNTTVDSLVPDLVTIGDNFISAPGSHILVHDASGLSTSGTYRIAPVRIGDNVFLGLNAIVLPGVTIGDNVIVGAGSVVTKDVPSDSVVAGVPARVICSIAEHHGKSLRNPDIYQAPFSLEEYARRGVTDLAKARLSEAVHDRLKMRASQPGKRCKSAVGT